MKGKQSVMTAVMVATLLVVGVPFGLLPPATSAHAAEVAGGYNPAKTYAGPWGGRLLYYRNPRSTQWLRGLKGDLSTVSCADAYNKLSRTGQWQGHLLAGGACGPVAEPSLWAVGNYLNFLSNSAPRE